MAAVGFQRQLWENSQSTPRDVNGAAGLTALRTPANVCQVALHLGISSSQAVFFLSNISISSMKKINLNRHFHEY